MTAGKDDATVVIGGDISGLEKVLQDAQAKFERFGAVVKRVGVAIFAVLSVKKLIDFARGATDAASQQERAFFQLEEQLKVTGQRAGFVSEQMKQMAKDIQGVSRYSADAAVAAQNAMTKFQNVKGDVFREALMRAADFAAVTGTDLPAAAAKLASSLDDPRRAIEMLDAAGATLSMGEEIAIRQLMSFGRVAEAQQVVLNKLRLAYGGAAQRDLETWSGRWAKIKNDMAAVGQTIGRALIPLVEAIVPYVQKVVEIFQVLSDKFESEWGPALQKFWEDASSFMEPFVEEAKKWINTTWSIISRFLSDLKTDWGIDWELIRDITVAVMEKMRQGIVIAFATIEYVITNWRDVALFAIKSFALGAVASFSIVMHFLTKTIPEALSWFGRNWQDVLTTTSNAVNAFINNLWKNIKAAWEAFKALMKGEKITFNWTPLLDGFKNTIKEIPEFSKRIPSELEKNLTKDVRALGDKLGGGLADHIAKRLKDAENTDVFKDIEDALDKNKEEKEKKKVSLAPDKSKFGLAGLKPGGFQSSAGQFVGLEELNKKIQGAAAKSPELQALQGLHKLQFDAFGAAKAQRHQGNNALNGIKNTLMDIKKNTDTKNPGSVTQAVFS